MLWIIVVTSFFCIFVLTYLLLRKGFPEKEGAELRLHAMVSGMGGRTNGEAEVSKSFMHRRLSPLASSFVARFPYFAPQSLQQRVAQKLASAGYQGGAGTNEYLLLTPILGLLLPVVITSLLLMAEVPTQKAMGIGLLVTVLGFCLPFFFLQHKTPVFAMDHLARVAHRKLAVVAVARTAALRIREHQFVHIAAFEFLCQNRRPNQVFGHIFG